MQNVQPVMIIGVSGATWSVLRPLIDKGRSPNIARLLERGTGANLASIKTTGDEHFRPQTAWPSLATGRHPDRHGITRFFHEAAELRDPALWDIYFGYGLSSGIYGWPGTWPPPRIKGFVVPSHLARDTATWPPDLEDIKSLDREQQSLDRGGGSFGRVQGALKAAAILRRYGMRMRTIGGLATNAPLALFGEIERRRLLLRKAKLQVSCDLFLNLYSRYRPDISAFVTFYVDFVSHRYWRYRDPSLFPEVDDCQRRRFANAIDDSYETFDEAVGVLTSTADKNTLVAVVSEHGMEPEPASNEIGSAFYQIRASKIAELVKLDPNIRACPVARWIAFRPIPPNEIPTAAALFREIQVVETGLPLFSVYEHNDEVIIKFHLDRKEPAYSNIEPSRLNVQFGSTIVPFTDIAIRSGPPRSAMHSRDGILVLAGPGIKRGHWLSRGSIVDFAPTLLEVTGLRGSKEFDGRQLDVLG